MAFVKVAGLSEFSETAGAAKLCLTVDGMRLLLVKVEGRVHAYENRCAHRQMAVGSGRLEGHVLACPVHEWQYDIRSGRSIMPDGAELRRFASRVDGDDVFVDVPTSESPP